MNSTPWKGCCSSGLAYVVLWSCFICFCSQEPVGGILICSEAFLLSGHGFNSEDFEDENEGGSKMCTGYLRGKSTATKWQLSERG